MKIFQLQSSKNHIKIVLKPSIILKSCIKFMKSKLKFIYQTKTNLKVKNKVLKSKIRSVNNNIVLEKPIPK